MIPLRVHVALGGGHEDADGFPIAGHKLYLLAHQPQSSLDDLAGAFMRLPLVEEAMALVHPGR